MGFTENVAMYFPDIRRGIRSLTGLVVFAFVALGLSLAQQETGQISGTVSDSSGAVIPGATVNITNLSTDAVRTTTTSSTGVYLVTGLQPSTYQVTIQTSNFQPYTVRAQVTVGSRVTVDAKLSVSGTTTQVEVVAEGGAQVNTQTQELSQVVDQKQISQLPSLTRNPYDFVALSGNISAGDSSTSGDSRANGNTQNATTRGAGFNINGARSSGTEILLDGVENVSVFGDSIGIFVPMDAVQEFRLITSNFEPQYGRASGGIVNVSTRSGSNAFHGDAWEFNRLSAYTANTVTNAQSGLKKGQYTRNQFGFAVGGPVVRNKLFFFASTEWTRVRSAAVGASGVPTPQFLALAAPNVQDYFQKYAGSKNFTFSSTYSSCASGCPIGHIDGIPDGTPVFGAVPFTSPQNAGGSVPQNTYNVVGRVDYSLSDKTQVFFRYVDYHEVDLSGSQFASPYTQYNVGQNLSNQAYLLNLSHLFTPYFTANTKASFSRFNTALGYDNKLQNVPTLFLSSNAQVPGTSYPIQLPGFYDTNPANGGLPFGGPQNTVQVNEDLSFIKGKHAVQVGAQIIYIQDNSAYGAYAQANEQLGNNRAQGIKNLASGDLFQFQAAVNPAGALPCVRNPYTKALITTPACEITLPATSPSFARSDRFHDWAVYAQDAWKATPRLTVNYGVRYEYYGVQHNNKKNLDSNFYYGNNTLTAQNIRNGHVYTTPNSPIKSLWNPQYGTVSPRIGLAYDVFGNGRTSLRAGYGISYERNFGNVTFNVIQNPPNYAVIVLNDKQRVTSSNAGPLGGANGSVPLPPTSLRNVDQNIRTAQTQFYSAAIDHELGTGMVLSVQYAASRGIHLYDIKNINGVGSGNVLLGDPVLDPATQKKALTRLDPQFSNINNRGAGGDSYYHAANVQFQSSNIRHTGLGVTANYTFAHQIDDLSTTFSETNNAFSLGYTDPFNPAMDRGNGDLDIRHRFVLAPIYQTPAYKNHGLATYVVGGWQVTGIYQVHSGTPFTYYDSTNNASGYNVARYTPAAGVVPQHTFKSIPHGQNGGGTNTYVLGVLPLANSWGNDALLGISDWGPWPATMTSRNAFRGPGGWNFDMSLSKTFPIHESVNLEFRAEGFNLLNHHNLYLQEALNDASSTVDPVTGQPQIIGSKGGIGNNSGANDERRFGQFALKLNF
ncbi:MAG TPA: TonB-dependent receptor [Acidisarcina sp.]|nr:TonB-dependent receptor [Acidisarcina sp.]